ncbi:MAG: hypothetical protein QM731_29200 [Chitinophagaceae bacterium]
MKSFRLSALLSALGLCLVVLGALTLAFRDIRTTLPYPRHVDEPAIAVEAELFIVSGSFHPSTFNYPSLPKYLAAFGLGVGFIRESLDVDAPTKVDEIGEVAFPYYGQSTPMGTARQLFALVGVVGVVCTGLLVRSLHADGHGVERDAALVVAPLIVLTTPLWWYHSWTYLNVDIVGACFTTAALWRLFAAAEKPSIVSLAIVPGVLAGLATASKYTLAPVMASVLLGNIAFAPAGRRLRFAAASIAGAGAAFLAAMPYALLDVPGFLNGLAFEGHHYATRHPGFEARPGWPQVAFYSHEFISQFGWLNAVAAGVGFVALAWRRSRHAATLAAFPAITMWLLIRQHVHFERNTLALFPIVAALSWLGIALISKSVASFVRGSDRMRSAARVGVAIVLAVGCVGVTHLSAMWTAPTESRRDAERWIRQAIAPSWTIVVPDELALDTRRLEAEGRHIQHVALSEARTKQDADALLAGIGMPSVILVPQWGADPFFLGEKKAADLREVAAQWQIVKSFGTAFVQTNHEHGVPDGDPAFGVAPLHLPEEWTEWLRRFDEERTTPRTRPTK